MSRPQTVDLPAITVRLRLQGDNLVREYHHPQFKRLHESAIPWTAVSGIEPVVGALRSGDVDALIDTLAEGR